MVTRGQRRLGRTIRNLERSVEFSAKESKARESERKYRDKIGQELENSPVKDLRYLAKKKMRSTSQIGNSPPRLA